MKLCIGCANFGQEYLGKKAKEIDRIWDFCRENGIDMADTAVAYDYFPPEDFKIVTKVKIDHHVRSLCRNPLEALLPQIKSYYAVLAHNEGFHSIVPHLFPLVKTGVSTDSLETGIPLFTAVVQCPYYGNEGRLRALKNRGIEVHVRKVFFYDCFKEAIQDPNVDRVVMGIDNLDQLKENFELYEKWKEE